jgi:hypothetical protein
VVCQVFWTGDYAQVPRRRELGLLDEGARVWVITSFGFKSSAFHLMMQPLTRCQLITLQPLSFVQFEQCAM